MNTTTQPQAAEFELILLSTVLEWPQSYPIASEHLTTPEAFYFAPHSEIWRAISEVIDKLDTKGAEYSSVLVKNHLIEKNIPGSWETVFSNILDERPYINALPELASKIMDRYYRRQLIAAMAQMDEIVNDTSVDLPQVFEEIEKRIFSINQDRRKLSERFRVQTTRTVEDLRTALTTKSSGVKTGLSDLDSILNDLHPGTLNVLAARTAMGKSTLALHIAHQLASRGEPVVFFSLEMRPELLDYKILAARTGIDSQKFLNKFANPQEIDKAELEWQSMKELPLYYDANPRTTPQTVQSTLRLYANKHGGKLGAVVIDYLQLMSRTTANKADEIDKVTAEIRAIAIDFDVPIIGLAQVNRGVESQSDKRPKLSDLRSSGAIEMHADSVTFIYRDEAYNPETSERDVTELIVAKNRMGRTGTAKILHNLATNQYFNMLKV